MLIKIKKIKLELLLYKLLIIFKYVNKSENIENMY